ncbi:MAG: DNA translocase FtsK 4TM domain-containing protein, partial [Myxococcales bacterium]|nr:DNA translocase FtsK 4TM domain-containing protein [Myxococcales bacterium]
MPELGRRHEVLGILTASATLLVGLALWSYDADGGENWIGPVGEALAGVLATAFGIAAWLVPVELALGTARLFTRTTGSLGIGRVASTVVIVLIGCAMVHLALTGQTVFGGHLPGGLLGEVMGEVLRSLLGVAGAYVVGTAILLITIVLRTPFSVIESVRKSGLLSLAGAKRARAWLRDAWAAWREAKELERLEREQAKAAAAPRIISDSTLDETVDPEDGVEPVIFADADPADVELEASFAADEDEEEEEEAPAPPPLPKKKARASRAKAPAGPTIVAPREEAKASANRIRMPEVQGDFELPPTDLFDAPPAQQIQIDAAALRANAAQLTEKLEAYRVKGRV